MEHRNLVGVVGEEYEGVTYKFYKVSVCGCNQTCVDPNQNHFLCDVVFVAHVLFVNMRRIL